MRDIEFRALGVGENNQMKFGYLSKDLKNSTSYYNEHPYRIHWHPESGGTVNCPVQTETIGQYTGLTDSEGVKIFEGDIVQHPHDTLKYECRWDPVRAEMAWYVGESYIYPIGDMRASSGFSVIGNIHESPELLKEAE